MKLAFLYAGQGSQQVGMGKDLYREYPAFRAAFDSACLDFDLKALCFEGPDSQLAETRYTQPCMVAFAAGLTAVLYSQGVRPLYAAGLSLGEYSALHAAGVFDAKTAIELAAFRGKAMTEAVQGRPCGMTAVLGLGRDELARCCGEAAALGVVGICNYNCPSQLVISGDAGAVEKAGRLALAAGARRCLPLKVSGPFHTELMKPAGNALRQRLEAIPLGRMAFPVLFNCLGGPQKDESIPALLERQVQSSVYMEDTIRCLHGLGVDTIVEIGPGRTLSGFVKKTVGGAIKCLPAEDVPTLQATLAALQIA